MYTVYQSDCPNHLPAYFPQMKISLPEQFNLYMFWIACVEDLLSIYLVGMYLHAIISEHVHTVDTQKYTIWYV